MSEWWACTGFPKGPRRRCSRPIPISNSPTSVAALHFPCFAQGSEGVRAEAQYRSVQEHLQPQSDRLGSTKNLTAVDVKDTSIVRRNTDADNQVDSIDQEITQLEAGKTRGGYYTLVVILRDAEEDVVDAQAAEIVQMLNRKGFQVIVEDDNFPAAFKGSLPGHSSNVRKPRLTVPHLVRLLVTSSPWRGNEQPSRALSEEERAVTDL